MLTTLDKAKKAPPKKAPPPPKKVHAWVAAQRRLQHEVKLRQAELRMENAVRRGLREQYKQVIDVLTIHFGDPLSLQKATPLEDMDDLLEALEGRLSAQVSPTMVETYRQAGQAGVDQVVTGGAFNLDAPRAVKYAKDVPLKFARQVNRSTKKLVRKHLSTAIRKHEGMREITNRMQKVFSIKKENKWRAHRIARTETNKVVNRGQLDGYKESRVVNTKTWLAGYNARDWHSEASGQTVNLDEPFIVMGEELDHPGDPSGSAENIINCRCTIQPGVGRVR